MKSNIIALIVALAACLINFNVNAATPQSLPQALTPQAAEVIIVEEDDFVDSVDEEDPHGFVVFLPIDMTPGAVDEWLMNQELLSIPVPSGDCWRGTINGVPKFVTDGGDVKFPLVYHDFEYNWDVAIARMRDPYTGKEADPVKANERLGTVTQWIPTRCGETRVVEPIDTHSRKREDRLPKFFPKGAGFYVEPYVTSIL